MLTPVFDLSQTDTYLTIAIKAPFAKISETEIFIEEREFRFFSKPYYLRLHLPGKILEDDRAAAKYDAEKGTFVITVPKETPGENFEGLDMLTKLLAPKGETSAKMPLIEVIESVTEEDANAQAEGTADEGNTEEEEFEWYIEQTPYQEEVVRTDAPKYGFGNQCSGVFSRLQSELCGVIDLVDPDNVTISERRQQRIKHEDEKFDDDHYLADLYQDETIQELLNYSPVWDDSHSPVEDKDRVHFTDEEKEVMRKLPRKNYLLDDTDTTIVYLGLVDILFAYAYNYRTTEGDNNVESGWTISKLSATLSWLEVFTSLKDVIVTSLRRSLCYPLYRHWCLSIRVISDVGKILSRGKKQVLWCLLEIRSILLDQESHYILNDLYINDYCVWIQSASDKQLSSLAKTMQKMTVQKSDIGFHLDELEIAAKLAIQEQDEINTITSQVSQLDLKPDSTSLPKQEANPSDVDKTLPITVQSGAVKDSDDDSTESEDSSTDSDDNCSESTSDEEDSINNDEATISHNSNQVNQSKSNDESGDKELDTEVLVKNIRGCSATVLNTDETTDDNIPLGTDVNCCEQVTDDRAVQR